MSENTINIYMDTEDKINIKDATQIVKLKGPKGDKGDSGPQGDNVNLETVAKIKNILLENNVMVHSDSLEGVMLDFFALNALSGGGVSFIKDANLFAPVAEINNNVLIIAYVIGLPFQINDEPIKYIDSTNMEIPITSSDPITVKFYNARMELMFTKAVEAQ